MTFSAEVVVLLLARYLPMLLYPLLLHIIIGGVIVLIHGDFVLVADMAATMACLYLNGVYWSIFLVPVRAETFSDGTQTCNE